MRYLIRAGDLPELRRLIERVRKIAEGAALMTETRVEAKVVSAVSNLLGNAPLERAMQDNLDRLGPPPFDDADRAFAAEIPGDAARRRTSRPPGAAPACPSATARRSATPIAPAGRARARRWSAPPTSAT